jgi:hypothetical protein
MAVMMAQAQPICHENLWTPMAVTQMQSRVDIVKVSTMDAAQALPVMQACSVSPNTQVLPQNAILELNSMTEIDTSTLEE